MRWPFGSRKRELETLKREIVDLRAMADSQSAVGAEWLDWFQMFSPSLAGPVVTADTALRSSAVFACVRLIASCISSSPCLTYKGRYGIKGQRQFAWDHPRAAQLRLQPHPSITASTFWKFIVQHKLLRGNGYAIIMPDRLIPVNSSRVTPYQAYELGFDSRMGVQRDRLFYYVTFDDGTAQFFDQDDILHFPNLGWDGKQGLSTITVATQNIGLAIAQEESSAKFYGQGAQYDLVLKYPSKVSKEAADRIVESYLRKKRTHDDKYSIPLILSEGGDLTQVSMSARDAQALEARQYSVIDQCRWFGVPPVMIGESEKTSSWGSGVEQVGRWFVTYTLNDHFTDIEQELQRKLFSTGRFFAEFDESELTRGDTKTRGEYYRVARGNTQEPGWMTTEEIRQEEGLSIKPENGELQKPTVGGPTNEPPASTA